MGTLMDRARAIALELNAHAPEAPDPLRVLVDPQDVATNTPCVLLAPPTLVGRRLSGIGYARVEWRLIALASGPASLAAMDELDKLLDHLADAGVGIERADPGTYQIGGDQTVACYVVTYVE